MKRRYGWSLDSLFGWFMSVAAAIIATAGVSYGTALFLVVHYQANLTANTVSPPHDAPVVAAPMAQQAVPLRPVRSFGFPRPISLVIRDWSTSSRPAM